jgi:hypothetical protein
MSLSTQLEIRLIAMFDWGTMLSNPQSQLNQSRSLDNHYFVMQQWLHRALDILEQALAEACGGISWLSSQPCCR